ncbi:MAG: PAS domain-containing protein [Rhodobacteraceae bacterium]|nr:PAS domain-containing protein [Paracoccaceae bacterium]
MPDIHFQKLINHWEGLRTDNEVPFRSQIDPRQFPELLENIFILENSAPEQYRIRHTGMMLCEMMGFEVRGQLASAMMQNLYREKMALLLGQVLTRPGIAEITLVAQDLHDNVVSLKMLLLPLRSDFGDVNRILGCISTPVVPYVAPLRFGIAGQKLTAVDTSDLRLQGFAENQAAFGTDGIHAITNNPNPDNEKPRKRGHLRLVSDKDQDK